jgi:hypothetical protein
MNEEEIIRQATNVLVFTLSIIAIIPMTKFKVWKLFWVLITSADAIILLNGVLVLSILIIIVGGTGFSTAMSIFSLITGNDVRTLGEFIEQWQR